MKRVLILGSDGMLGQELVKTFSGHDDYKVCAWNRTILDLTNEVDAKRKILTASPDIIINTVSYNKVDKCEEVLDEYEHAVRVNTLDPANLAQISNEIGSIIVHYSTDYVFGGNPSKENGYTEGSLPYPVNKYGTTKLNGENKIRKVLGKHYIIRLSRMFGYPGSSENSKKSFFEIMIGLGKTTDTVKVVNEEISCFTYSLDLATETKRILDSNEPFGTYHITNGDPCTWYDATCFLYKMLGIGAKIVPISSEGLKRPAKRPCNSTLINTKTKMLRSWKKALADYLESK